MYFHRDLLVNTLLVRCPPRDPLTFLQALRRVVGPGVQQAGWRPEPSFSLILQAFSSPRVMRNRSGSDLEAVGRRRAGMRGLGALLLLLECIICGAGPYFVFPECIITGAGAFSVPPEGIISVAVVVMVIFMLSRPHQSARQHL